MNGLLKKERELYKIPIGCCYRMNSRNLPRNLFKLIKNIQVGELQTMLSMKSIAAKSARFHGRGERSGYSDALGQSVDGKCCATVLVSVGKPNFEGPELKAILGLVDGVCEHTVIIVSDTLQRFNREVENKLTPEDALALSRREGQYWDAKCRGLIEELHRRKDFLYETKKVREPLSKGKYEFVHWDHFRCSPSFRDQLGIVNAMVEQDIEFSSALAASVDEYCRRRSETLGDAFIEIEEKYRVNCRLFLIEECAAMLSMSRPFLYPGKCTPVLQKMIDLINSGRFYDKLPEHKLLMAGKNLDWIEIRFKDLKAKAGVEVLLAKIRDEPTNFYDTAMLNLPSEAFQPASPVRQMLPFSLHQELARQEPSSRCKMEAIVRQCVDAIQEADDPRKALALLLEEIRSRNIVEQRVDLVFS